MQLASRAYVNETVMLRDDRRAKRVTDLIRPLLCRAVRWSWPLLGAAVAAVGWTTASADTILEIKGSGIQDAQHLEFKVHDLQRLAFAVDGETEVRIEAVGASLQSGEYMFAYPWIIDARTRALVWSMDEEVTEPVTGSNWLRRYDDDLRLRQGTYELYYYSGWPDLLSRGGSVDLENLGDVFKRLGEWLSRRKSGAAGGETLASDYYVRVTGNSSLIHAIAQPPPREAVVSLTHPGNDAYLHDAFTVRAPSDLEVYAIGEYSSSGDAMVDWGWIADATSGRRVWEMDHDNTDPAGGAEKNRLFHDHIHLAAGNYVAYYVSDDSHTYDDWNSPPPYDPEGWGLQVFVSDAQRAQVVPCEDLRQSHPLLQLVGIGDNELRSAAFRLSLAEPLRVYAIGEYDKYGDQMSDYAWVVRREDKRKVWTMTPDNTEPAGGASKNRQFDGVVDFAAGDYTLYYSSDGSHSYGGGWNAAPPHDQKSYGVSLFAASDNFDPATFTLLEKPEESGAGVLAAITRVGNDADIIKHFTLRSPTRVRIVAEGEGGRDGMADYGWIEDAAGGDIVWEMTYRKTAHAGGAEKNRMVDQTILLDKGEYAVHYVSDDSHAYGSWNDDPPTDPESWGITVSLADKNSR